MRSISIITKSILVVTTALLVARDTAHAESRWSRSVKAAPVQATATKASEQRVSAAGTAVVHGTFYLTSTSCVGAAEAFNVLLYVRQNGYRFTVHDSAGMRLTGRGNRAGFSVGTRKLDRRSGVTTTHEISAGPVLSDYTANFRYSATLRRKIDGASCQSIFEGNLKVN
jgi:hypothetical protein